MGLGHTHICILASVLLKRLEDKKVGYLMVMAVNLNLFASENEMTPSRTSIRRNYLHKFNLEEWQSV